MAKEETRHCAVAGLLFTGHQRLNRCQSHPIRLTTFRQDSQTCSAGGAGSQVPVPCVAARTAFTSIRTASSAAEVASTTTHPRPRRTSRLSSDCLRGKIRYLGKRRHAHATSVGGSVLTTSEWTIGGRYVSTVTMGAPRETVTGRRPVWASAPPLMSDSTAPLLARSFSARVRRPLGRLRTQGTARRLG